MTKQPTTDGRWRYWVDRGGTFTDIVACDPGGVLHVRKVLSVDSAASCANRDHDPVIASIRDVHGLKSDAPLPLDAMGDVKVGTTVATNALLERTGQPTALVTNRGFADVLEIGYQNRPDIFARAIIKPAPLYSRVVEIDERISADGTVVMALKDDAVRCTLKSLYDEGLRAVAVHLMHGARYPTHERRVADIARAVGFDEVVCGHDVSGLVGFIARGETAVLESYLSPVLRRYVDRLEASLGTGVRLSFMQSHGGLIEARGFRAKDAILSGPAGGVVGMARVAAEAGFSKVIGFDMGGTSTDVSHYAGTLERLSRATIAGVNLTTTMLDIHTVAAGGGSICVFDGARFRVGPQSAGADPGPACYRRGGPLTITDCNVMIGVLQPDLFPQIFGPSGDQPIDRAIVETKFASLAQDIERETGKHMQPVEIAAGFLSIGVANMANAIKKISTERGHNLEDYALVCFGGAAGQHATAVADGLGIQSIISDPLASVLSAFGIGCAEQSLIAEESFDRELNDAAMSALVQAFAALESSMSLPSNKPASSFHDPIRTLHIKYAGTEATLPIPFGDIDDMRTAFEAAYRKRYSFTMPKPLIVAAIASELVIAEQVPPPRKAPVDVAPRIICHATVFVSGEYHETAFYDRESLAAETIIEGPAVIVDNTSSIVVTPGWRANVDDNGKLILEQSEAQRRQHTNDTSADPVRLELFNRRFMAIAEQMGVVLQNTATSVNIKERLDFSCALFDGDGALIANAPHIPVHLGSMGASVQAIREARLRDGRGILPGDVYLSNNPYAGGTHLPDLTVVQPVFLNGQREPDFFVAARGHHADIGGITPGSIPPSSTCIEQEGVLFDNMLLVDGGAFHEDRFRKVLASASYPARNPDQNVADVRAQIASCARGTAELDQLVLVFGRKTVKRYMQFVRDNAEEAVRRLIDRLADGAFTYAFDNGAIVSVATHVDHDARRLRIDFTGTSPQRPDNFNAPSSICRAAVLYVIRTSIDDDIPLNDGCLLPVDIIIPHGSMLDPSPPAAVVAGNVETSQVITDALLGAMQQMAASQGTMNNLTFGDDSVQYYETICGGAGAGPDFDGASAVQTHMTNSRLTDPEIFEERFPVRLSRFAIRRGSGGAGQHQGGDGVTRHIMFLKKMQAAIVSNRRQVSPFGLHGGGHGQPGQNAILRCDGSGQVLDSTTTVEMFPGDVLVVKTPGGGGFGAPT